MRKTKLEILNDVVALVQRQGRAIDVYGACRYLTEDGRICGHSMACQPELRPKLFGPAYLVLKDFGDRVHLPEYQGHPPEFWNQVQKLHDFKSHWAEDNTLNKEGISHFNFILSEYEK